MRLFTALLGFALTLTACTPPDKQYDPPPTQPPPPPQTPTTPDAPRLRADHVITNDTNRQVLLRIRRLRADLGIDCRSLSELAVDRVLTRDMFAPAEAWLLEPGRQMALVAPSTCGMVALIDGSDLALRLYTDLPSDDATRTDGVRIEYLLSEAGEGRLRADAYTGLHPAPSSTPTRAGEACGAPTPAAADWSEVPPGGLGEWVLDGVTRGPDGCSALDLTHSARGWSTRWYVCTPQPLPFAVGERMGFVEPTQANGDREVRILGESVAVRVVRGDAELAPEFEALPIVGCGPAVDDCGSVVQRLALSVRDDDGDVRSADVGVPLDLGDGHILTVIRAERVLIADQTCVPGVTGGRTLIEYVETLPHTEVSE